MNQQYYYNSEDSTVKFLESFRFCPSPLHEYILAKQSHPMELFYNLSLFNNILYTSLYFVTFCSGNGVNKAPNRSLGTSAAAKSMLFCISFIDSVWRTTHRPALCSPLRKHFSKKWTLTLWYVIAVISGMLPEKFHKLAMKNFMVLFLRSLCYSTPFCAPDKSYDC